MGQRRESQLPAVLGQSEVLRDRRGRGAGVSVAERDRAAGESSSGQTTYTDLSSKTILKH